MEGPNLQDTQMAFLRTCPWSNWSMAPGGDLEVMKSDMGMSCLGMTWNNQQYAM